METRRLTGLRKRQQIDKANRMMFLWVAAASVALAFSLVAAQFLFKQAAFNQKIIAAKSQASRTLDKNLENASVLKEEVNKLIANQVLSTVKPKSASAGSSNLQVVLDALPTENDPSALAASFQQVVLNRSGVSIERFTASNVDSLDEVSTGTSTQGPVEMPFEMVLTGTYDQIKTALADMERVIRPIDIKSVAIQGTDNQLRATIEGTTYYQPEKSVNLTTKKISP